MGEYVAVKEASPSYVLDPAKSFVPIGYKQTEIGLIPADWDCVPIERLGNGKLPAVKAGPFGSSLTKDQYVSEGYKVYGQEQVIRGDHLYGDYFINEKKYRELESCSVKPGDVLLSLVGTMGKLLEIPENAAPGVINPRLLRITLDKAAVMPRFFKYLFQSSEVQSRLVNQAQGGTMGVLNAGTLKSFYIQLPSLEEQGAIATALSDVDALLEELDRLIAKKRALKKASMQQLLTGQTRLPGFEGEWESSELGNIAEIVMGQSPSSYNYNTKGDGLPLIQGNADIEKRKTIQRIFTRQITKLGKKSDVLLSVRAPVGEVSRATFDVCLGRGVCAIRFPNDFLYHYLIYLEPRWTRYSKGSTFDSVNSKDIQEVKVNIPSESREQMAIATILSNIDNEIDALEQRRTKTAAIKKAMMQQLLTGRTRF